VDNSYARLIRNGDVRGNGGGAPVTVSAGQLLAVSS